MTLDITLPDLEERFLPPKNWINKRFINPDTGHDIHYSFALPQYGQPKGIIVILPGLSEFTEKYIETTRFFLDHNFGVYIIDWAYQGRSSRFLKNTQKRYSDGYESDLSDLDFLIKKKIKTDLPLYMLAHSMGGHIGLRYMTENPKIFNSAAITAPMMGMSDIKNYLPIVKIILSFFKNKSDLYIPMGKDWHEEARHDTKHDIFSSDPVRKKIHNIWSLTNPILQVGSPTMRWLDESIKSIAFFTASHLEKIKAPVLIFAAGKEKIVDNDSIIRIATHIPHAEVIMLPSAKHEIWVETDDIRNLALEKTLALFNQ